MNDGLIPSRYAKALYKYAKEQKASDEVYQQMKCLEGSFVAAASLQAAVDNPYLAAGQKQRLLLTASSASQDGCFDRFVKLLIKNNRVNFVRGIALAYQDIYRKENGIVRVVITTAAELPQTDVDKIKAIVVKAEPGKQLEFDNVVNPDIIGGFTIAVESMMLDASVKNELKKLRLKLLS